MESLMRWLWLITCLYCLFLVDNSFVQFYRWRWSFSISLSFQSKFRLKRVHCTKISYVSFFSAATNFFLWHPLHFSLFLLSCACIEALAQKIERKIKFWIFIERLWRFWRQKEIVRRTKKNEANAAVCSVYNRPYTALERPELYATLLHRSDFFLIVCNYLVAVSCCLRRVFLLWCNCKVEDTNWDLSESQMEFRSLWLLWIVVQGSKWKRGFNLT